MSNKLAIPKQLAKTTTEGMGPEVIYTSPAQGAGTVISAVTVSNNTLQDHYYLAYIGKGYDIDDPIIPDTTIKSKRTDPAAELVGQVIPPGHSLWFEDPYHVLLFTVSGRELLP